MPSSSALSLDHTPSAWVFADLLAKDCHRHPLQSAADIVVAVVELHNLREPTHANTVDRCHVEQPRHACSANRHSQPSPHSRGPLSQLQPTTDPLGGNADGCSRLAPPVAVFVWVEDSRLVAAVGVGLEVSSQHLKARSVAAEASKLAELPEPTCSQLPNLASYPEIASVEAGLLKHKDENA